MIYYMEHLLQDMDENQMLSRALLSFMHFKEPSQAVRASFSFQRSCQPLTGLRSELVRFGGTGVGLRV